MAMGPHAESEAAVVGAHHHPDVLAGKRMNVVVVTPRGQVSAKAVDEVIAPGETGEFGVLPGHVPFLAALKPGVLTLRSGSTREIFAVGPGYLQVSADGKVTVLIDQALGQSEI